MAGWRDLVRGVNKAKKSHPIPIAYFGVWDIHMLNITFTSQSSRNGEAADDEEKEVRENQFVGDDERGDV